MPTSLLIDLTTLDLGEPRLGRDEIALVNPHRGAIVQLDAILWHDDAYSSAVGVKHVRDDEFWTDGHIPGMPLMPGVLMIEAAAQLTSFLYYSRTPTSHFAGFTRIEDTTFRGVVRPGDELMLLSRVIKFNPKRFVSAVQGVVDGNIVFDGKITGMLFPNLGMVRADARANGQGVPT